MSSMVQRKVSVVVVITVCVYVCAADCIVRTVIVWFRRGECVLRHIYSKNRRILHHCILNSFYEGVFLSVHAFFITLEMSSDSEIYSWEERNTSIIPSRTQIDSHNWINGMSHSALYSLFNVYLCCWRSILSVCLLLGFK